MKLDAETRVKARQVIALLKEHPVTKPIKAPVAAEILGMSEGKFRELARRLTSKGIEISSDDDGFWWAYKAEDMLPKIHHLESRIVGLAVHLKGAKMAMRRLERAGSVPRDRTFQLDLEYQNVQNQ